MLEGDGENHGARNNCLYQGGELPADLLTQAQAMKPPGFTLHVLPADASAEDIAAAMQEAEYLMGFVRFLPDKVYARVAAATGAGAECRL